MLVRARARDDEAHVSDPLDEAGQRLEGQLEPLLVHQPSHQEDQPLVRVRKLCAKAVEIRDRNEVRGIDPVGDHRDAVVL